MKKVLLSVCTLGVLFASSCKKSDNGSAAGGNTWKLGGTTYTATTVVGNANVLGAANATGGCTFEFGGSTAPTAGTYKVVDVASSAGEVSVIVAPNSTTMYNTTDHSNVNATVTVSGSKISVSLPATYVVNVSNSNDSLSLTANVTQTN